MPPYFNLSLQFQRKDLYPGFMADFEVTLDRAGVRFKSGYWNGEGYTQAEIAAWNQKKLEEDFKLGFTEDYSHNYKQSLYEWKDYSHVRGIWMNRYPSDDTFSFELIVPEAEVVEYESWKFFPDKAAELAELAKGLWQFPAVKAIQTGMEDDAPHTSLRELRRGVTPCVRPFAIVERDCHPFDDGSRVVELTQGRPGLLLLEEDDVSGPVIEVPGGGVVRLKEKDPN